MTPQELIVRRRMEWKDWFVQAMAFGYAQTDALRRAAASKGLGMDLKEFSRPFPGSPVSQTITDNSVSAAQPPVANTTTTTTAAPIPASTNGPGFLSGVLLAAVGLIGSGGIGLGLGYLLHAAAAPISNITPISPVPAPSPTPPAPGSLNDPDLWKLRIVP